jgi:hypothetical protein
MHPGMPLGRNRFRRNRDAPIWSKCGTDALVRPAEQRSAFNDLCKRLSKNHFHSSSSQMEVNRLYN